MPPSTTYIKLGVSFDQAIFDFISNHEGVVRVFGTGQGSYVEVTGMSSSDINKFIREIQSMVLEVRETAP